MKITKMLIENNSKLKEKRASMLSNQLKNAMQQKTLQIQNELDKIDLEIDKLLDVGPRSSVDLTVGNDVNAIEWINKLHDLYIKKDLLINTDVKVNKLINSEFFSDEDISE